MHFKILGEISGVETFAEGAGIREIARLRRVYGRGRWRKRKGVASGVGRKEFKIKQLL
ncbi:MAG: hypothetical protein ACXWJW_05860 [Xanthobacteraceae bacterium]